ncbi:hypothetical protein B0H34DRAFT_803402 [Crassisporium funariophilum]|nr:hypothetical protein B0H34DRAFT_803402 [Crassisporium funariophilum]
MSLQDPSPIQSSSQQALLDDSLIIDPSQAIDANDESLHPLTLTSFIPILEVLPGFVRDGQEYHIHGVITETDWDCLRKFSQRVEEFTLTDSSQTATGVKSTILPPAFIMMRLALVQKPGRSLMPSLRRLHIDSAQDSLPYFQLLISPTLQSIEASNIPDKKQPELGFCFSTLLHEVPHLQEIMLSRSKFPPQVLQTVPNFTHLHHLSLCDAMSAFSFDFLVQVGALPELESFELDTSFDTLYSSRSGCTTLPDTTIEALPNGAHISCTKTNSGSTIVQSNGAANDGTFVVAPGFHRLNKLRLTGNLIFLQEFLSLMGSPNLMHIELELLEGGPSTKKKKKMVSQPVSSDPFEVPSSDFGASLAAPPTFSQSQSQGRFDSKGPEVQVPLIPTDEPSIPIPPSDTEAVGPKVFTFACLIARVVLLWPVSLKRCTLNLEYYKAPPLLVPTLVLSKEAFVCSIEYLEVKGWRLDCIEESLGSLDTSAPPPKLQSLHLPLDRELNPGISLSTLRHIANACPDLRSFQSRVEPLRNMLELKPPKPDSEVLSHALTKLTLHSISPPPDRLILVAHQIYSLFPNLEVIEPSSDEDVGQWRFIHDLVKMCQTSRKYDQYRTSVTPQTTPV